LARGERENKQLIMATVEYTMFAAFEFVKNLFLGLKNKKTDYGT
jgi:hypothetical protein